MSPLTWLSVSCYGPVETVTVAGDGRLHHEISGPTWEVPNRSVGDLVPNDGTAIAAVAGSTLRFTDDRKPVSGTATPRFEGPALQLVGDTLELPELVGVWDLELRYEGDIVASFPLVTTWSEPIEGTPLYERMLLWTGQWLEGTPSKAVTPEADIVAMEDAIALKTLRGMSALEGRSYGAFARPKDKDNQAHVWLDFERSACGEYRGGLMNLVESHGVDAQWVMMSFRDPSPEVLSMYETRVIAAVGREAKVWQHWNHVAVEVNGQVYDPSYDLHAESWNAYEDDLFERYCYGEAEKCKTPKGWCQQPRPEGTCIDNPPGFDEDDPVMALTVWRGDAY